MRHALLIFTIFMHFHAIGQVSFQLKQVAIFASGTPDNSSQLSGLEIIIYPNPVQNVLFIDLPRAQTASIDIKLFDISGKLVLNQQFAAQKSPIYLDLRAIYPGIYFLRAQAGNEIGNKKVIHIGKNP